MLNLQLQTVSIDEIPLQLQNIKSVIKVQDAYFILAEDKVHRVEHDKSVVISDELIRTLEFFRFEKVIVMGTADGFEVYDVRTKEHHTVPAIDYKVHAWDATQGCIVLLDQNGDLAVNLLDVVESEMASCGMSYKLMGEEASPFVNVGWGSAATQFRGKQGKVVELNKTLESTVKDDDGIERIAWREDGEYFVVGYVHSGKRVFKVFSKECEFLYSSEPRPGMCAALAWKPDGSVIATEQILEGQHNIVFFEKNGLYRNDFPLRNPAPVRKLCWNPLGDILTVWQSSGGASEISLWTCKNFKWYLKQNLVFAADPVVDVNWHDKKCLEVVTSQRILRYTWQWIMHQHMHGNVGVVCVIDGRSLQFTVTSKHILPPPMHTYVYEFQRPINWVTFSEGANVVGAVLDDGRFVAVKYDGSGGVLHKIIEVKPSDIPLSLNHFAYDSDRDDLVFAESFPDRCRIRRVGREDVLWDVPSVITALFSVNGKTVVHANNISIYDGDDCVDIARNVPVGDLTVKYLHGTYHAFCLCNDNTFYYNDHKISNQITSYLFFRNHLLITTTEPKLLCFKLSVRGLAHLAQSNFAKAYSRNVADGSILIGAVLDSRKIILQVPRGDIETINPRILAIEEIERLLSLERYLEAYLIMRTDRLNPNLLYDINPQRFLDNAHKFIADIHNCEYLDVFLTQLQDANVSETLYTNCFEEALPPQSPHKVQAITNKFVDAMRALDHKFYLQSIITAYMCSGELEKALRELRSAKAQERLGEKFRLSVDATLEHMIVLSSVEKLYETAFGMIDFELLTWVASKSQMDPLEYLPFLRELNDMEKNYREYRIFLHIKRYEEALTRLVECDDVSDELETFIDKHNLYKSIVKCVRPDNKWYKQLIAQYGHHLHKKGYYDEAAILFRKVGLLAEALEATYESCNVTEALSTIECFPEELRNVMYIQLIDKLENRKMYKDAGDVYELFLNNYEMAIVALTKGKLWTEAVRLAMKHNRNDMIEINIKPELYEYTKTLTECFVNINDTFIKYKARLRTVREQRIAELTQNVQNVNDVADGALDKIGDIDVESVVSTQYSTTSRATRSSHMTSASMRRHKKALERKVTNLREGGEFEDIALMRQLHLSISEAQGYTSGVCDVCKNLLAFDDYAAAAKLYSLFRGIVNVINGALEDIWPEALLNPLQPTVESKVYQRNIDLLEMKFRLRPSPIKMSVLYSFE